MSTSLTSGVSGLKSQQTRMDVIGNNIANVNTYGFKSSRVTFRDVYYQTLTAPSAANGNMGGNNASQIGYGAQVGSVDTLNTRTGFASTGLGTDCYIDGEGYFVVKDGAGKTKYTQVGTFGFDGSGNLVDGNGGFVCGYPVASKSGKASVGSATIDFGTDNNVGKKLDADSLVNGYSVTVKYAPAAATSSTTIDADADKKTITITFTPDATTTSLTKDGLQTALTTATWNWPASGTGVMPTGFDKSKILVDGIDPAATAAQKLLPPYTDTVAATTGMTAEVAKFNTTAAPEKIINSFGELTNLTIGTDGTITGQDGSGTIQIIGQIALANIPNPGALTMQGNSYYVATNNTGAINYDAPGSTKLGLGKLKTGGLESSNVDLATEFSDMIMTQRGFQANSKIITVSDEMLETLVNMKR